MGGLGDTSVAVGDDAPTGRPSVSSLAVSQRLSFRSSVISTCRVSISVAQERCCAGKWRVKSCTWAVALVELVCSVTALIASVAIVPAEMQSRFESLNLEPPSWSMIVDRIIKVILLGVMVVTTVILMFALNENRPLLILPHWIFSILFFLFHLTKGTLETIAMGNKNDDFVFSVVLLIIFGSIFTAITYMEYRCYAWIKNSYR